jgi:glycosyltransferase involved in cell wall biosynthesis
MQNNLPEVLFISSYPPRECGIATYTQDLINALKNKYINSFSLKVCALESNKETFSYPNEVIYVLNTQKTEEYLSLAEKIEANNLIQLVFIQHEFGFFSGQHKHDFMLLIQSIKKPKIIAFHTVLPQPSEELKNDIKFIASHCEGLVVMTQNAALILLNEYDIPINKIEIISHGTHLVAHKEINSLKRTYGLNGKKVLSTFGLLSAGKGIETTIQALPKIIAVHPEVIFLIIGKTHPNVVLHDGEIYRNMLLKMVEELQLSKHVLFINEYLPTPELLEYLQLTDIYLFTSKDPNQAVSGTFAYAMSCGCPIISTPIPHALEVLNNNTGIIIDFNCPEQLAAGVIHLLNDNYLRKEFSNKALQITSSSAWENAALAHALFIHKTLIANETDFSLRYRLPEINLNHVKKMSTPIGMVQFAKINQPDLNSGYTLDDTARALIAICMQYDLHPAESNLKLIQTYLSFIHFCQQDSGDFLNYVDQDKNFTSQNYQTNLSDSNGRGIWALGYLLSLSNKLPLSYIDLANEILIKTYPIIAEMRSPRAMAFAIKGLYYANTAEKKSVRTKLIKRLAERLLNMYLHEATEEWAWYESYLTYANAVLPEAMLCAYQDTQNDLYKEVAETSFSFLTKILFTNNQIKLISNQTWLVKGEKTAKYGEQPIDVCYTILALQKFYELNNDNAYSEKMNMAFNWFMGNNHLNQIIYNPCTGGCYDGIEETQINLNQGAESTLSYLLSRLTVSNHLALKKKQILYPKSYLMLAT